MQKLPIRNEVETTGIIQRAGYPMEYRLEYFRLLRPFITKIRLFDTPEGLSKEPHYS